ncbi:thiol:disulfide interchange protein DsbA/DsbL [Pseudoalteromonas sp. T1lg65]|uniref:thiol:disulfide interchange protein DsbA/DsbL n=1 Tax=Pseudoalteromonas sp. T1lg65 TaxID=2077101 RepID=UPI003F7A24F1
MLKRLKVAILALCFPVLAIAADFQDGKHYTTLNTDASKNPKVTEFFSFYCPHCYRLEPVAKAVEDNLPDGVKFVRSHVNFLGGASAQTQSNLSYAYIIAKQEGKGEQIAQQLFHSIHERRERFLNIDDVKRLLELNGIPKEKFDQAMTSMPVIVAEAEMVQAQQRMSDAGGLNSVPTFIVNDKYKIEIRSLKSQQELNELVAYLLKK